MATTSASSPVTTGACFIAAAHNDKAIVRYNHQYLTVSQRTLHKNNNVGGVSKLSRRRQLVVTSSSDDDESSISSTATETDDDEAAETPAQVPKGPPSLISALNVEKALRGIAITDVDHYGRLGLSSGCSYDQVNSAYKDKVAEVMKDKGLTEEDLNKELELLQESHSILSSVEERRIYDWSLARSGNPDRYVWPFEVDLTQTPIGGTPPPQEPEDEGPTRLVGSIVLGWLVLSFTLFVILNTN